MFYRTSTAGARFTGEFEGMATRAYLCPAGVPTIGKGFTMRSKVFAEYWMRDRGHALKLGDTISASEVAMLLPKILDEEYGAAVNAKIAPRAQHQYDGAASMTFNCGTGATGWKWAQALKRGDVAEAARLLRVTAITANGRKLAGLERRREAEATLIETGNYGFVVAVGAGAVPPSVSTSADDVCWYQERLAKLGYAVDVTGKWSAPDSEAAVRDFQRDNSMVVDGKVGPATRATIIRALDAKQQTTATVGGGVSAGGVSSVTTVPVEQQPLPPLEHTTPIDATAAAPDAALHALYWGVGIAVAVGLVIAAGYLIYRYRGRITGQRVPT